MAQQNTYQTAILAAIDAEIATVQTEYKAALAAAGARLQAAQARSRVAASGGSSGVLLEEASAELEPELAVALHKFETRLDQLKELRDWIKIDPDLAGFVAHLEAGRTTASSPAPASASPSASSASAVHARGVPAAVLVVAALLALVVGWLVSIVLPAASLLPR